MDKDLALNDNASPPNGDILIADSGEGNLETLAPLKEEVSDMSRLNDNASPPNGDILIADRGEGNLETLAPLKEVSDMSQLNDNASPSPPNGDILIADRGEGILETLAPLKEVSDMSQLNDNASPPNGDILIADRGEGNLETLAPLKEVSDMSQINDNASPPNGDILIADSGEGNLETLARLKEEVSDMSRERALLTDKLVEMGQQTDLLQRQKHEFESQVGELQAERDFLSRERGALENHVSDLRNRIQANEAEQREISEQREDAWETEKQGLIFALSESTQRISDLAAEVEDLQTRNNVMLDQCARSDRLVNQVCNEEDELRINVDSLNKRLEMLAEENESLRLGSALKAQAMWSLEDEVRKLSADIAAVEEEKATLSALNSRMASESAASEGRLAEAVKSTERHDMFVEGLQVENGKLELEKAILQRKIDEMGALLAELSRQLDARGAENPVAELQAELAATRSAHEEASLTLGEIREYRESLAKKMGLQCSRNKELEDDLISLRSSFEKMQQANSNNQQCINDLEQQVSTLASEKRGLEDTNRLLQIELNRQILGSAAEDHEQFGERIRDWDSANTDGEPRDVKIQQSTLDHPTYQLHSDQVGERIRDLEIALDAAQKALASTEMTVQQLTAELQSLQSSFETKQKGKQIAWPAVAASTGAVVAAACLVYVKYSKQR